MGAQPGILGHGPSRIRLVRDSADSRGNRLADYHATRTKDGSRCFIEASCCSAVLNQIQMVLDGRSPRLLSTTDFSRWQYKIEYEPPYSSSIHNGLEMLKTVLTLGETDEMDGAIALDFYKIPEEGVPGDQWENTEVGQLIHRGKYYSSGPSGAELSKRIAETMSAHPYYSGLRDGHCDSWKQARLRRALSKVSGCQARTSRRSQQARIVAYSSCQDWAHEHGLGEVFGAHRPIWRESRDRR